MRFVIRGVCAAVLIELFGGWTIRDWQYYVAASALVLYAATCDV